MIKLFRTDNHEVYEVGKISEGVWIKLEDPTHDEISSIADSLKLDKADVAAAIDPEENMRIDMRDNYTLILIDIPIKEDNSGKNYRTIPLGIICTDKNLVTICSRNTPILQYFYKSGAKKDFSTKKILKFAYQIMLRISVSYQHALLEIDKKRIEIESHVGKIKSESDFIKLHEIEVTLVYFKTSLCGNNSVLSRLMRPNLMSQYMEDKELLEDLIIENQQAIEMAQIYREVINSTRELISSIMNLRINKVMKSLTLITVIFSIPMVISGMYGMNVDSKWMPLAHAAYGFEIILILTVIICLAMKVILKKRDVL